MFEYFTADNPVDNSYHKSITYQIYESFHSRLKVGGMFLDISNTFSKVWHDCLMFKLSHNGTFGNCCQLVKSFRENCKQVVILNGQASSWTNVLDGVSQGSILGLHFFMIYNNDLSEDLSSTPKLLSDDISHFSVVNSKYLKDSNDELVKISINFNKSHS